MLLYALKMLIGDRAKYIGIILGLSFASFIISQQAAIFLGLMSRTFGFITDTSQPNIWVMDRNVQYIDDIKPLRDTELFRVQSIEGVAWAVPFYKGLIRARLADGNFQTCILIGIDGATLIGAPPKISQGNIEMLRMPDAVFVNDVGARDKLSHDFPKDQNPLRIGDRLELNDNRAVVVGICQNSRTFQSQPVIYTTYERALAYSPIERKLLSFVLVRSKPGVDPAVLCRKITAITGLAAYTSLEFKKLTISYYIKYTGIPINFGVAVILGFIIGVAIAGQTFYNFTLDNLRYFATFKAMGADTKLLTQMILVQSFWAGAIGWGIGVGAACLFGFLSRSTELSFRMPWPLFLLTALSIALISMFASWISMRKVRKLDPAIVFKS
ncbi:MAG: ABC transporter permease [Chlamydiota bacterium]